MLTETELRPLIISFQDTGKISDRLGEMILELCSKIGNRHNFINYTGVDDFVSQAILETTSALKHVDLTRTTSVFAYLNRVAWNSFKGSIRDHKRHYNALRLSEATKYVPALETPEVRTMPLPVVKAVSAKTAVFPETGKLNFYENAQGEVIVTMDFKTFINMLDRLEGK